MTIEFKNFATAGSAADIDLTADDDIVPDLARWRAEGKRVALVTLVGVEGGAPRGVGAQMAVSEAGEYAGYLSGGCLEQAVALEARDVIAAGAPRMIRYGDGSPYFDIRLPCGSGLDLHFDPLLSDDAIQRMCELRAARRAFALDTELTGGSRVVREVELRLPAPVSVRRGEMFSRLYTPQLRLLLLGSGPAMLALGPLAAACGFDVMASPSDDQTREGLARRGLSSALIAGAGADVYDRLDAASAAVLLFHDHPREIDLLVRLLDTRCYFIGALGNRKVHRARLETLAAHGLGADALARVKAPVGLIPAAKSKATLAIGVLAALLAEAKAVNLVS